MGIMINSVVLTLDIKGVKQKANTFKDVLNSVSFKLVSHFP